MWQNLKPELKERVLAAGEPPDGISFMGEGEWEYLGAHRDLFEQYLVDNCQDEQDKRRRDVYWWLLGNSYPLRSAHQALPLLRNFEETYGPGGQLAVNWPSEVTGWFQQRDELDRAAKASWKPEWDALPDHEDPTGPEWDAYRRATEARRQFELDHPYPLDAIQQDCRQNLVGWYKAYRDEVERMLGAEMPATELDRDFIDSVNKLNLDGLEPGQGLPVVAWGYYVLIGQHSPGYLNAVGAYTQGWTGTLTMKARGGAFSAGKVEVTGCEGEDQKWFKEAFRRVSKKEIVFL